MKEKILHFYNFNANLFKKDIKYENKEISFIHTCTKILGDKSMFRTLVIPSEQLFEKRIDEAAASSECKSEFGLHASNRNLNGTKRRKVIADNNDIGSVKGTKKKISSLEDHLKRFRRKFRRYFSK